MKLSRALYLTQRILPCIFELDGRNNHHVISNAVGTRNQELAFQWAFLPSSRILIQGVLNISLYSLSSGAFGVFFPPRFQQSSWEKKMLQTPEYNVGYSMVSFLDPHILVVFKYTSQILIFFACDQEGLHIFFFSGGRGHGQHSWLVFLH